MASALFGCGQTTITNKLPDLSCSYSGSWSTVDAFTFQNTYTEYDSVGADLLGNVFVNGYGTDTGGTSHWLARKSSDHGTTWAATDDYVYPGGTDSEASSFGKDAFQNI